MRAARWVAVLTAFFCLDVRPLFGVTTGRGIGTGCRCSVHQSAQGESMMMFLVTWCCCPCCWFDEIFVSASLLVVTAAGFFSIRQPVMQLGKFKMAASVCSLFIHKVRKIVIFTWRGRLWIRRRPIKSNRPSASRESQKKFHQYFTKIQIIFLF